jgi:hypothetical protein
VSSAGRKHQSKETLKLLLSKILGAIVVAAVATVIVKIKPNQPKTSQEAEFQQRNEKKSSKRPLQRPE